MKHHKYHDIGQFRNVIQNIQKQIAFEGLDENEYPIYNYDKPKPVIEFVGTVKIHGTNAAICENNDVIWTQSKTNIIAPEKDNNGFAFFVESHKERIEEFIYNIKKQINCQYDNLCIYGEWAGGNIQKGVAINGLDKFFTVFSIKYIDIEGNHIWIENFDAFGFEDINIYDIKTFGIYKINIDFNNPKLSQNTLIQITQNIEEECPVGKYFGRIKNKDCTVGEGAVWYCFYKGNKYIFKVKGEKHSSSKVKKLAEVDTEKIESISKFVDYAVTENRLNQAIEQVFTINNEEISVNKTGDFLRWIVNDINKEEMDTLVANKLEPKDVNREISSKARIWFMNYLEEN